MTSLYAMLRKNWKAGRDEIRTLMRQRMVEWRREPAVVRVDRPLRLDRARSIGYKAEKGFVVLRVRVRRGGFQKARPRSGRRQKAMGVTRHKVNVPMREEAINRAVKKYSNLKPLGSYPLASDSLYRWFEVVAVNQDIVEAAD